MNQQNQQSNQQPAQPLLGEQRWWKNKRITIALVALVGVVFAVAGVWFLKETQSDVSFRLEIKDVRSDTVIQRYELRKSGILIAEGEEVNYEKQLSAEEARSFLAPVRDSQIMRKDCIGASSPPVWDREYVLYFEGETKSIVYRGDVSDNLCADELQDILNFSPVSENEEGSEEEVDISNWQTYRNEEYGFEVRYPSVYDYDPDHKYESGKCSPSIYRGEEESRVTIGPLRIHIGDIYDMSLVEYVEKKLQDIEELDKNLYIYYKTSTPTTVTVDGRKAIKIDAEFCGKSCGSPVVVYTQHAGRLFRFVYHEGSPFRFVDDDELSSCRLGETQLPTDISSQILSTFRFVDE